MVITDIEKIARENTTFRTVLHTGTYSQVVVMSLAVGEDIGEEVHDNVDQILIILQGEVEAILGDEIKTVMENGLIYVPAGVTHNIRNTSDTEVKLITVYSPPEHPDRTVHSTKADAVSSHE